MKNGLPSDRAWIRRTTSARGRFPGSPASISRCWSRSSGAARSGSRSGGGSARRAGPAAGRRPRGRRSGTCRSGRRARGGASRTRNTSRSLRRRVAPVEVLEDEDERPLGGEPVDQGDGQLEQPICRRVYPSGPLPAAAAAAIAGRRPRRPSRDAGESGRDRDQLGRDVAEQRAQLAGGSSWPSSRSASRNGPNGRPSPPRSRQARSGPGRRSPGRSRRTRSRAASCRARRRRRRARRRAPRRSPAAAPSSSTVSSLARPTRCGLESVPAIGRS